MQSRAQANDAIAVERYEDIAILKLDCRGDLEIAALDSDQSLSEFEKRLERNERLWLI